MSNDKRQDADDFIEGGTARVNSEAWSPKEPSEAILGMVHGFKSIGRGEKAFDLCILSPVVTRDARGAVHGFNDLSVAVSATLKGKLGATDTGKVVGIVFRGWEGSGASAYRMFDTVEQTPAKLAAMLRAAGAPPEMLSRVEKLPF